MMAAAVLGARCLEEGAEEFLLKPLCPSDVKQGRRGRNSSPWAQKPKGGTGKTSRVACVANKSRQQQELLQEVISFFCFLLPWLLGTSARKRRFFPSPGRRASKCQLLLPPRD
ncbi:hypothetical protein MRB53_031671 [Persea americana]|uniref:Uncharacterized protein n=1 Tax=Persea americana TaxID=3435 RepID=A0ACC2KPS6_PERAE|nr:hypothetical protein MRB53_031671 [Persea americana]